MSAVAKGTPPGSVDGYIAARALLVTGGVPVVAQSTVAGPAEAVAAAEEIGYPVVLKALGLLHKSDAGGVVLGLEDRDAVATAYGGLERRLAPVACSVERMVAVADGVELLAGDRWDLRFGPVVLVGSGGIHAELLRDTVAALAPVSPAEAEALLRSLKVGALLDGGRGRPPLAIDSAAKAIAAAVSAPAGTR